MYFGHIIVSLKKIKTTLNISINLIYLFCVKSLCLPKMFVGYNKLYNVREVITVPLNFVLT